LAPERWELNEGDYRQDERVYDHITSTGMVSHVGPRGLAPYVRNVRRRIKTGGRYLHHALMTAHDPLPIDFSLGIAFNKKYVWPGFHWFTVGEHVRALEKNGFQVERVLNLTRHYAKTTMAWYERMMANRDLMVRNLGEPTFRAWQVFLAGVTGAYLEKRVHVYRLYCEAV
jgi:cyclopropane fatty-acyl-phospholipid synthase-like methyltransferase